MSVQYPKQNRGGIGLPSVELGNQTILRDPPKAIHTRKHEPVNLSDVTYLIRESDDRLNEAISYYAKGVNPMVEVSYSNNNGPTQRGPNTPVGFLQETKNPYKIMKDSAYRPPIYTQAELLPLSRQKFSDYAAITNPGLTGYSHQSDLFEKIDKPQLMKSFQMNYTRGNIRPTVSYNISYPTQIYTDNNISELKAELNSKNVSSPPSSIIGTPLDVTETKKNIKEVLLKSLSPNFSIIIYDSGARVHSVVDASTKDKENIAVSSSIGAPIELKGENGQPIKLKDYQYSVVNTSPGVNSLMLTIQHQPDLQLGNNRPLYSASTNISGKANLIQENTTYNLINKQPVGNVYSQVSNSSFGTPIQLLDTSPYTKASRIEEFRNAGFNNAGTVPVVFKHNIPNGGAVKLGGKVFDAGDRFK